MTDQHPQQAEREPYPQPFHPGASHIEPGYRDGWNAALEAARASTAGQEPVAQMYVSGPESMTAMMTAAGNNLPPGLHHLYDHPAPDAAAIRAAALEEALRQAREALVDDPLHCSLTFAAVEAVDRTLAKKEGAT